MNDSKRFATEVSAQYIRFLESCMRLWATLGFFQLQGTQFGDTDGIEGGFTNFSDEFAWFFGDRMRPNKAYVPRQPPGAQSIPAKRLPLLRGELGRVDGGGRGAGQEGRR